MCSTDDDAIAAAAAAWGAEVLAPAGALATDARDLGRRRAPRPRGPRRRDGPFETLVLLQPTSPLTDPADVVAAVGRHREGGGVGVTSVVAAHPAAWHHAAPMAC